VVRPQARDPQGEPLTEPVYRAEGGGFVPTGHARSPWDPAQQHGGGPAALIARAIERLESPAPMLLARLTIDFLGAVPLAPLTVEARVVRPGRRLQIAEAMLASNGTTVCRARGVLLRRAPVSIPEAAQRPPRITPPDDIDFDTQAVPVPPHGEAEGFGPTAMDVRFADGRFGQRGPATAWFRLRRPLVDDEEPSGMQRAVAAADFGNGISSELSFDTHLFINTDLSVHLAREPVGEWIAVEAITTHGPEGTALASSVLHDVEGPVGRAAQSLYVAER
jgi:hypothetical protein